jgi:membrane protease YdiL (CAAX protease family)
LDDAHTKAAMLAALPVWLGLCVLVGEHMRSVTGWRAWIWFVLLLPVAEELVFRGVLQGQLLRLTSARRAGPLTLANLCTTAGFVAMHLPNQPLLWALAVAVPSMLFGHLRERFDSVLPAMMLHAYYNTGFALTAWWVHR